MDKQAQVNDQAIIRRAIMADFDSLYTIFMQDHVIPFLTFERIPKEQFKPIIEKIMQESEVYVMEDKGKVVATRRIILGQGIHAHSVQFASFGVHQDHLKNGYGTQFFKFLVDKIKTDMPHVKRIELVQDTDNEPAFHLAKKMGFEIEIIFPDRIRRRTGPEKYTHKWHMGARFKALLIDPLLAQQAISAVTLFRPRLPTLHNNVPNDIRIHINEKNNIAECYYQQKRLGVCTFIQGERRYEHIAFWSIQLEADCDVLAMQACMRQLFCQVLPASKKIETYVADPKTLQLLEMLGFHCRGKKIGSCKINQIYYDEVGLDLGFFDIQAAKELLTQTVSHKENIEIKEINELLNHCHSTIQKALAANEIDNYAARYLENMAFQMIREGLGTPELRRYAQENAPWNHLIEGLTDRFKKDFFHIANMITEKQSVC